jgi:hypothetical protein
MAKEHMQTFRQRQAEMGRKGRLLYLTDSEFDKIKIVLVKIREMEPQPKTARDEVLEKVAGLGSALNSAVAELTKAVEKL